jgi:hypothetical protein
MRARVLAVLAGILTPALLMAQVPAGSEFRVNTYTTSSADMPSAASLPGGGFVVVWLSAYPGGVVTGQVLEPSGAFRGVEFQVAPGSEVRLWPDVATDVRGRFVVAWQERGANGIDRIAGRRFDPSGAPLGGVFAINAGTSYDSGRPAVAMQQDGAFVVVWESYLQDGGRWGVFGRRFDASGQPAGPEFQVNTYTTLGQRFPRVAADETGRFVVVWDSAGQDGSGTGVFGQRFLADGARAGPEFQVNAYTTGGQVHPLVLSTPGAEFVVVWRGYLPVDTAFWSRRFDASGIPQGPDVRIQDLPWNGASSANAAASATGALAVVWDWRFGTPPEGFDVLGRRFELSGTPRGQEFLAARLLFGGAAAYPMSSIASDQSGNLLVTWVNYEGGDGEIRARRYGGLLPAALAVDESGNAVLEPGETAEVRPSWRNVNGAAQTFGGTLTGFSGPAGASYTITDPAGDYGTVADGATQACADCFGVAVSSPPSRPTLHWDGTATEAITPDVLGQSQRWRLHIGESFTDVPRASPFYRFVETLLHRGITAGCGPDTYCPAASTTREQMAVFLLLAKEAGGYSPAACTTAVYPDVPASSPFCRWIEELSRRGVVGGCGGGNFCPGDPVTREQMAVFVLRTLEPALDPPACVAGSEMFADVPASSPFCRWIEELARRGVVAGCGGGNYCPTAPVTRDQMSVFLTATFGLTLYGP